MEATRQCSHPDCNKIKNLSEFKPRQGGYTRRCKSCINNQKKEYYLKNKDRVSLSKKAHYLKNKDRIAKYKRSYFQEHFEMMTQRLKNYWSSDRGRKSKRVSSLKRRALKMSTTDGSITIQSLERLMIHQKFKCADCQKPLDLNVKNSVHLDHYIPLSKGGSHNLSNVRYCCAKCNIKKSDIMPKEFIKDINNVKRF